MLNDTLIYILTILILFVSTLTKVKEGFLGSVIHMYYTALEWQNAFIPSADKSPFDTNAKLLFFK